MRSGSTPYRLIGTKNEYLAHGEMLSMNLETQPL